MPLFLWLHFFDPHSPYAPPARFLPEGRDPSVSFDSFGSTGAVRGGTLRLSADPYATSNDANNDTATAIDSAVRLPMKNQ